MSTATSLFYTVKHELSGHFFLVETLGGEVRVVGFFFDVLIVGCTLKIVVVAFSVRANMYTYTESHEHRKVIFEFSHSTAQDIFLILNTFVHRGPFS